MLKDFFTLLDWFRVAALLRFKKSKALFKEGEIWWCHVGMNPVRKPKNIVCDFRGCGHISSDCHKNGVGSFSNGMNIGTEIYGKGPKFMRPVLVLKKFSSDGFLGVPLTSRSRDSDWYSKIIAADIGGSAVLNQIRTFDAKRLIARMGVLTDENFCLVKKSFLKLCEQSDKS